MGVWAYEDKPNDGFCFKTGTFIPSRMLDGQEAQPMAETQEQTKDHTDQLKQIAELPHHSLPDRGISRQVAERYGVRVEFSPTNREEVVAHYYPYYAKGHLVAYKKRKVSDKSFNVIGNFKNIELFGQHRCGSNGKLLIVTEGECDCMAAFQMLHSLNHPYRVVSVPNGASGYTALKNNLEWLEGFQKVVFAYDMDEAGQEAAYKACDLLSIGKGHVMQMSEKDPNDMLRRNKAKEFYKALSECHMPKPDGIVSGQDTWEMIQNRPAVEAIEYPEDWQQMNAMTYGMRLGELDTWTSGTGMGKTQVMKELIYHMVTQSNDPVGIIFLEEPLEDTVEALMGMHLNKRIHLPDVEVTEEDKRRAWEATSGTGRLHFANSWADEGGGNLLNKIRYFAKGLGCKRILLDHLHMITTEDEHSNEVAHIDRLMSKLKKLTRELNIWIGLVVHLRKTTTGGKSFEQGAVPTLDDLRGSSSIKQLSNSVFALARNQQALDEDVRNTTSIHTLKCRFTGRTGPSGFLRFDPITGRMYAVDEPIGFSVFDGDG